MEDQIYNALISSNNHSLANYFLGILDERTKNKNRLKVVEPVIEEIKDITTNRKSANINIQAIYNLVRNL